MALQDTNEITFLYIFDSRLTERLNYPTSKSITRKVEKISETGSKSYVDVHERPYGFVEGMLIDIQLKTFEKSKEWYFWLQDGVEKYCLKLRYSSRESKRLLSYLPNADLGHFIRVQVFREKEGSGTALLVKQRDAYLKSGFTKDNPNGLPQMVKGYNSEGKEVWNDDDQMVFFEKLVNETLNPKLHRLHGTPARLRPRNDAPADAPPTAPSFAPVPPVENGDDLPF